MSPQASLVWDYLSSGRELTPMIATMTLGVSSVTTRISEIRRAKEGVMATLGKELKATWSKDHMGKRYRKYQLVDKDQQA